MRSDLSKSLKLNCGESGCLEGGIQSGASRQCCRVNAGGDTATQERKKEEEKENREQQRLIRPFFKKKGKSVIPSELLRRMNRASLAQLAVWASSLSINRGRSRAMCANQSCVADA